MRRARAASPTATPIRIHNERGELRARARVTDRIRRARCGCATAGRGSTTDVGAPAMPDEVVDAFGFSGGQATFDAMVEVSRG